MKIEELEFKNFRGFKELSLSKIPENLIVFIGVNGAGKSSILDAISYLLNDLDITLYLSYRLKTIRIKNSIKDKDICNQYFFSKLLVQTNMGLWFTYKKRGDEYGKISKDDEISRYLSSIKEDWKNNHKINILLAVYYSVNRRVSDISLETPRKDSFTQVDAYAQALKEVEIDFNDFFQWFRQREDIENEFRLNENNDYRDKQLETVRNAILQLMPNFTNFRVKRSPPPLRLTLIKNGESLVINQLSDGEKSLIAMIGDLARRLVIANPSLDNPLEGQGIVLIDEIELHLHPQWQREIIPKLLSIFPNCQFFITTHSPQVLSNVPKESIFILEDFKVLTETPHSYGRDSNSILYDLFNVPKHPKHTQEIIDKMFDLMEKEDEDSLAQAKELLKDLETSLGEEDTEIVRAKTHLDFVESFNEID